MCRVVGEVLDSQEIWISKHLCPHKQGTFDVVCKLEMCSFSTEMASELA